MADSLISKKWMDLEIGSNGHERVLHVQTEVVCNPQSKQYDPNLEKALVEEAAVFLSSGMCDRVTVHARFD